MTDKELLELAAKASGIEGHLLISDDSAPDGYRKWRPLTDDGDALRLAVKLGMLLDVEGEHKGYIQTQARGGTFACYEDNYTDPYAAIRRAIVRAAAEIGKGMKCKE